MADARTRDGVGRPPTLLVGGGLLSVTLLVGLAFVLPGALVSGGDPRLFVLASLVGLMDLTDVVVRIYFRRRNTKPVSWESAVATSVPLDVGKFTPRQMKLHIRPYAIVVSVHDAERELDDFLEAMRPYLEHLWVIDDASSDGTFLRLQHAGVNCRRGALNRKKPGALRELISTLRPEIETVVVLDPDSRILDEGASPISNLERVIFEFQRSGMAAVCPRIAVRDEGLLSLFQELEYWMSFALGRKSLRDCTITSGIAIYNRDALERTLNRHTLSVYAEDLKNAVLLLSQGNRIYYDGRLVVRTAAKGTWKGWFSQRVAWYFGLLKVYAESFRDVIRIGERSPFFTYQFLIYTGGFTLLMHPLKIVTLGILIASLVKGFDNLFGLGVIPNVPVTEPTYFFIAYVEYLGICVLALFAAVERGSRLRLLPVVPLYFFYALFQIVPTTVGYLNWLGLRFVGRRVYRDHFQDDDALGKEFARRTP